MYLEINNLIHTVEQWKMPFPTSRAVIVAGVVGVPIAVLLHDTAHLWLPRTFSIPIVSFFQRRWRKDEKNKQTDLSLLRNFLIFFWIAATVNEPIPKYSPLDFIADRLGNTTARRQMTHEIQ